MSTAAAAGDLRRKQVEEELRELQEATTRALVHLLDLRDISTGTHSTRLAEWAVRVAIELGLEEDEQRQVEAACLLHDIGKIGVPDSILRKASALDESERAEMSRHPQYAWTIFRLFPHLQQAGLFALHHHEHFDGTGYPAGLRGEEIPVGARIVAVVDAFDAMISDRCYRLGLPLAEALARLRQGAGSHFDPAIVDRFVALAEASVDEISRIKPPSAGDRTVASA